MKTAIRYWFWRYIMRNRRRAGGILAAQTRRSGPEARAEASTQPQDQETTANAK
jgi:hypothetical protein